MNTEQIQSYIRSALKIIGAFFLAHGYAKAGGEINQMLNMPDIDAFMATGVGLIWSHFAHAPSSASSNSGGSKPPLLLLLVLCLPAMMFTGCQSASTQKVTYQVVGATAVTVEGALAAYDQFAAAGKTTPAENSAVAAAYAKYQAAFTVVCDAGAVYSASSTTNAPAASAALQTAVVNANQSISDLVALVESFGVALK